MCVPTAPSAMPRTKRMITRMMALRLSVMVYISRLRLTMMLGDGDQNVIAIRWGCRDWNSENIRLLRRDRCSCGGRCLMAHANSISEQKCQSQHRRKCQPPRQRLKGTPERALLLNPAFGHVDAGHDH